MSENSQSFDSMIKWSDLDPVKRKIIQDLFQTHWKQQICSKIMDCGNGLWFRSDSFSDPVLFSFSDPVLLLQDLHDAKVIEYKFERCFTVPETNSVLITAINWNRFQHLIDCNVFESLTHQNSQTKLQKIFNYEKKKYEKKDSLLKKDGNPIILGDSVVSGEDWYLYWNIQGKPHGPENGWEIPTVEKLQKCIKDYKCGKKEPENKKLKA